MLLSPVTLRVGVNSVLAVSVKHVTVTAVACGVSYDYFNIRIVLEAVT